MKIDKNNSSLIYADSGKIFKRISDGLVFGNKLYLGYTYYIGNKLLQEPLLELPEHYIEIDETEHLNSVNK